VEQLLILKQEVLLATALAYACSNDDQKILCRVLIDPESQSSFVTRAFVERLRLKPSLLKSGINTNGIGGILKGILNHVVTSQALLKSVSAMLVFLGCQIYAINSLFLQ